MTTSKSYLYNGCGQRIPWTKTAPDEEKEAAPKRSLMNSKKSNLQFPQVQLKRSIEYTPTHQMRLWQSNPELAIHDWFDYTLDVWQADVVEDFRCHERIGLIASKGPGKTAVMAMLTWWFFLTKHQPKIGALSVTKDNLKANLWAELLMLRSRSKLAVLSTIEGSEKIGLRGHENYAFIQARSYPKSANEEEQASALAGLHANNVMFVIDEAGTIPEAVFATADAALTTGQKKDEKCAKIMATANPEIPSGTLYRAARGKTVQKWKIHRISGDPEDPKRAPRVSKEWAQEQIDMYGRDHPWVMVNVLAKYPQTTDSALLTEEDVEQAMARNYTDKDIKNSQVRLGVDVARGGIDDTVLFKRKGLLAYPPDTISSTEVGPEIAARVVFKHQRERIERVYVDGTGGYGSSVVDSLYHHPDIDIVEIKYNAKAQEKKRYFNKRTEMWVRMRDWVKKAGQLPRDNKLIKELVAPKLFFLGGVFRLEDKQQMKDRIGFSPDRADALAQTFADLEEASFYADYSNLSGSVPGHAHQHARTGQGHISDKSQEVASARRYIMKTYEDGSTRYEDLSENGTKAGGHNI